jgi:hypothetical protein
MVEQHRDGFIYPFFITDWCQAELVEANLKLRASLKTMFLLSG